MLCGVHAHVVVKESEDAVRFEFLFSQPFFLRCGVVVGCTAVFQGYSRAYTVNKNSDLQGVP